MNHELGRCAVASALLFAAAGAVQAQSTVQVFGLIDLGVESVSNVGGGRSTLTRMPSLTGELPSRLGLRGSEDLGGGLKANFVLEAGLTVDAGGYAQGGRPWGRQALVGLSGAFGSLSFGRQYTMLFWSILDADLLGPNLYSTGSLDAGVPNARADNAIAYKGTFGGLTVGATWSLGRDAVNAGPSPAGTNCPGESTDSRACREVSWMLKYDTPAWGLALADDRQWGRTVGAAPDAVFGGMNRSDKVDRRLSANGWAKWGGVKVGAGLIRRSNDGDAVKPKSDLIYLEAAWQASPALVIDGGWMTLRYKSVADVDATLVALRATYSLSRRTAVYTQVGHIANDARSAVSVSGGAGGSNPAPGVGQSGVNVGVRHVF